MSRYNKEYYQAYYQKHKAEKLEHSRAWREANPDKVKEIGKRYRDNHPLNTEERRALRDKYPDRNDLIRKIALYYGCCNPGCPCRTSGYVAVELDFHHPGDKESGISKMKRRPKSEIAKEINRCVVLCANCHRRVHAGVLILENPTFCHVNDELQPV